MSDSNKPCALHALSELPRLGVEIALLSSSRRWLMNAPKGDGHGVMLIPGFLGDDSYNRALLDYLNHLGYTAVGWGLGQNMGPRANMSERLAEQVEALILRSGGKVTVIGHSLGGVYAREIARQSPEFVRQVISLGSPINQGRAAKTPTSKLFDFLNPPSNEEKSHELLRAAPPVPTTSVYTKADGVVHWKNSIQSNDHQQVQNIRVYGSHTGLTANASVWSLLAERLAVPEGRWRPFERPGVGGWMYPSSAKRTANAFPQGEPLHA